MLGWAACIRTDDLPDLHGPPAGRAVDDVAREQAFRRGSGSLGWRVLVRWAGRLGGSLAELLLQSHQPLAEPGGEEAVIADFDEALRQHMLQEAMDEGFDRERAELGLTRPGSFVAEGHAVVLELHQPPVAEGDAEDVRG